MELQNCSLTAVNYTLLLIAIGSSMPLCYFNNVQFWFSSNLQHSNLDRGAAVSHPSDSICNRRLCQYERVQPCRRTKPLIASSSIRIYPRQGWNFSSCCSSFRNSSNSRPLSRFFPPCQFSFHSFAACLTKHDCYYFDGRRIHSVPFGSHFSLV